MLRIFNFCSDLWYIFVVHLHGSAPILVAQVHDSVAHFVFFSRSLSLSVVVSKSITSYANKLRFNNLSLILFSLEPKKGSLLKLPFVIRLESLSDPGGLTIYCHLNREFLVPYFLLVSVFCIPLFNLVFNSKIFTNIGSANW